MVPGLQKCNDSFLGSLSLINILSRPMPKKREWVRMESQFGRYFHQNMLCLLWIETYCQVFDDREGKLYDYIIKTLLSANPFHRCVLDQ